MDDIIKPIADDLHGQLYRLPNNYGASVVPDMSNPDTPDAWELRVIKWWETEHGTTWASTEATPVTDDIICGLGPEQLQAVLRQIASLPDAERGTDDPEEDSDEDWGGAR